MKLKFLLGIVSTLLFSFGAIAQQDSGGIKQDTKDAADSTANAAKKTGHKIKHRTKKVVHKAAHETKKGAAKVEGKTKPPQ